MSTNNSNNSTSFTSSVTSFTSPIREDQQIEAETQTNQNITESIIQNDDNNTYHQPFEIIPLIENSPQTIELLRSIGGSETIYKMIKLFYEKMFNDIYLDQFVLNHNDPHFRRLGSWIIEKMGGEGAVWSEETRTRCPVTLHLPVIGNHVVTDRTSAHEAAWHCPKRNSNVIGNRFKLHDCRVWMRLMFWAGRESGAFNNPSFENWYIRFIGDYISIYERSAPPFARDSARWSLSSENIERYIAAGRIMDISVMGPYNRGVSLQDALASLPMEEATDSKWPY